MRTDVASGPALTFLLSAVMALTTMVVSTVGVLAPFIVRSLRLTSTQFGLVPSGVYVAAALTSGAIGAASDRVGSRVGTVATLVGVAIGFALVASAPSFLILLLAAGLSGCTLAAANPVTNRVVVERYGADRRGAIVGWKQAGVPAGSFITGLIMPTLALSVGWRQAVALAAVVPLLCVPLSVRLLDRSVSMAAATGAAPRRLPRTVWVLSAFAFLMGGGGSFVNSFLALFAVHAGFSRPLAGTVVALTGAAGLGARVWWANAGQRWPTPHLLAAIAAIAMIGVALLATAEWLGPAGVWMGAALLGVSSVAWVALGMLSLVQLVPQPVLGRSSGVVQRGFYVGLLVTPPLFGLIVDRTGGYWMVWAIQWAFYTAALVLAGAWAFGMRWGGRLAER
jgi:MFS family permease